VTAERGSQKCTVRSLEPEMSQLPSGEKATESTKSWWPLKVDLQRERDREPERSQTLRVLSSEPDASDLPSGEKATECTDSVWPS